jgi:hypothetical protein
MAWNDRFEELIQVDARASRNESAIGLRRNRYLPPERQDA